MEICKDEGVKFFKLDDGIVDQIKEMLKENLGIRFEKTDEGIKPPVMVLTFDPDGHIMVVTSEKEFNIRSSLLELLKLGKIKEITAEKEAHISTGKGSGAAGVNIGGESLTDTWPWTW